MTSETSLTLSTYNILHPVYAVAQKEPAGMLVLPNGRIVSNWIMRAGRVVKNIKASDCDIACLQEASPITLRVMREQFNLVGFTEIPRKKPPRFPGARAGNALLLKQGAPVTAGLPLLLGGHHPLARKAAAAVFTHTVSAKKILVISAHATGYNPTVTDPDELTKSKSAGFMELQSYLNQAEFLKRQVDAIVIAGDLNEDPQEDGKPNSRHDLLRSFGYCSDGNLASSEPRKGRKIDWIYVWSKTPVTSEAVTTPPPHPEASDHLIVTTRFVFQP